MSINKCILTGNLTRDMEVRTTASGMPVGSFGIAVNDRVKQQGEWTDYANFFDCTLFGSRAQSLAQYMRKGQKVAIEGKLRYSTWEKDGQKRSKVEVLVDDVELLGQRQQNQGYGQEPVVVQATVYDENISF